MLNSFKKPAFITCREIKEKPINLLQYTFVHVFMRQAVLKHGLIVGCGTA
jgi:hypothetical protein